MAVVKAKGHRFVKGPSLSPHGVDLIGTPLCLAPGLVSSPRQHRKTEASRNAVLAGQDRNAGGRLKAGARCVKEKALLVDA